MCSAIVCRSGHRPLLRNVIRTAIRDDGCVSFLTLNSCIARGRPNVSQFCRDFVRGFLRIPPSLHFPCSSCNSCCGLAIHVSVVVHAGPSAEHCVAFHALFLFSDRVPKSSGHHGESSAGSSETVTYLDVRTESANSVPILCQRSSQRTSIRRHPAPRAESESVSNCTVRPHCRMAGIGSSAYSKCRKSVESSDRCVRFFTYQLDCCRTNEQRIHLLEVCANEACGFQCQAAVLFVLNVLHRFHRTKAVSPRCERDVKDIGFRSASHRSLSKSASRGFLSVHRNSRIHNRIDVRNLRSLDVLGQSSVLLEDSGLLHC